MFIFYLTREMKEDIKCISLHLLPKEKKRENKKSTFFAIKHTYTQNIEWYIESEWRERFVMLADGVIGKFSSCCCCCSSFECFPCHIEAFLSGNDTKSMPLDKWVHLNFAKYLATTCSQMTKWHKRGNSTDNFRFNVL